MISGVDYKKRTRTRFVIYAIVVGPPIGFLLFVIANFLLKGGGVSDAGLPPIGDIDDLLPRVYILGTLPALFCALLLSRSFTKRGGLTNFVAAWQTALAYAFLLIVGIIFSVITTPENLGLVLAVGVIFFALGTVSTLMLWCIRPRKLIGPMTKQELAVWREQQDAVKILDD